MGKLEVKQVKYSYGDSKMILKGIDMELEAGKMYVILGPSGCGKTTLLSLMGGLDVPTEGEILCNGVNVNTVGLTKHRRNNISFIFQNYNLIDYMTPMENVSLVTKESPVPVLDKVGLTKEEMKRNVLKLSGGQQQRVAIARALASSADIILADEPTGNLDQDNAAEITRILQESAHKYNKCVVIVSHSNEVASQADKVFRLNYGEIVVAEEELELVKA